MAAVVQSHIWFRLCWYTVWSVGYELLNLTMHMHRTMVPKRLSVVICTPIFKPLYLSPFLFYTWHCIHTTIKFLCLCYAFLESLLLGAYPGSIIVGYETHHTSAQIILIVQLYPLALEITSEGNCSSFELNDKTLLEYPLFSSTRC